MLILTIRDGGSFQIGNHVKVRVLGTRGHQTRIGIEAPKNIPVHRTEIADKIRAENGGTIPGKEVE
jgi:carbon storage regulator